MYDILYVCMFLTTFSHEYRYPTQSRSFGRNDPIHEDSRLVFTIKETISAKLKVPDAEDYNGLSILKRHPCAEFL